MSLQVFELYSPVVTPHLNSLAAQFNLKFDIFEEILLSPLRVPEFNDYLKNYFGLARSNAADKNISGLNSFAASVGENLANFFQSFFVGQSFLNLLNSLELSQLVSGFEATVNLAIYNWYGLEDRNYQFRTVVHFYSWEGMGQWLFHASGENFFVSFSEDGIRFGPQISQHIPTCFPAAVKSSLWQFSHSDVFDSKNDEIVFDRVRFVQSEICFLVDEWEYKNTLLAVEHSIYRDKYQINSNLKTQDDFEKTRTKMAEHRDWLANWCLFSFVSYQNFLCTCRKYSTLNQDIMSEMNAADALLLSGIQKIFLPASISRHKYQVSIPQKFLEWCVARQQGHPDDVALELLRIAFSLALGIKQNSSGFLPVLYGKSHQWKLDFDPCSGLKAFSWLINSNDFEVLMAATLCAVSKKSSLNSLDAYWVGNLASLAQMSETFEMEISESDSGNIKIMSTPLLTISIDDRIHLKNSALEVLARLERNENLKVGTEILMDFVSKMKTGVANE